jgi:tetratricopeptide (TPR) repeat protein
MADGREEIAFERLRVLEEDHPEHKLVRQYLSSLQLKLVEAKLQAARSSKHQERYGEAAELYREALRIAPEAAGLYLEAAEVELLGDEAEAAREHAARAAQLEPDNVLTHRLQGDALRQMGKFEEAIDAYQKALALRSDDRNLARLLNETRREFRRESLPSEFSEIENAERVSREELSALLYVRLRSLLEPDEAAQSKVIATDIADSWAREFIRAVVAAEIMSVYPNHTFQPKAFVRKADLAAALIAAWDSLALSNGNPTIANDVIRDVSPENLRYRPAALSVSLGLLSTDSEGRFEPQRFVSGLEAITAVEALAERLVP